MYIYFGETGAYILNIITTLNIFFIANAIVYQGLKFPKIFHEETSERQKYEKNPLLNENKKIFVNKIQEYMENKKPYLNPTLSLPDLAKQVNISPFVLSQILNQVLNQNFYDFVNNYRIEESKRLLANPKENGKTILEILYMCGFNSKSVFNSFFRKNTGMTPTEFRKSAVVSFQNNSISPTFS